MNEVSKMTKLSLVVRLRALAKAEHDDLSIGNEAADRIIELEEWLDWIADHSTYECDAPETPCLNMSPEEGACLALRGNSVEDYTE